MKRIYSDAPAAPWLKSSRREGISCIVGGIALVALLLAFVAVSS